MRVPFGIIKLTLLQKPPKRHQAHSAKPKTDGDQYAKDLHQRSRSALIETVKDDDDIANAAINGEHSPATASGTASKL